MPLQATSGAASYDAFGGGVAAVPNYIEDIFSTTLYTGNGSTQTINNGIDLAGKGGLVWTKTRNAAVGHGLIDTVRGGTKLLQSNTTATEDTFSGYITAFGATGYTLGASGVLNDTYNMASWTFRKQPKFFDVVTFTAPSSGVATINHNLGSVPGCIILKITNGNGSWFVYHRGLSDPLNQTVALNSANAAVSQPGYWTSVNSTSVQLTVGTALVAGFSYVMYVFAHNAGGFGLTGTDNVISCGSFTTDGSGRATVNLGYEPQWLMLKNSTSADDWFVLDNMRGMSMTQGNDLNPNNSTAESSYFSGGSLVPTSTGFNIPVNIGAGQTWVYIAIRRGPMRTPTTGTSVFAPLAVTVPPYAVTAGFPVDLAIFGKRTGSSSNRWITLDRLRGGQPALITSSTAAENTSFTSSFASNTQFTDGWSSSGDVNVYECFRRAPGFFDVVCYTGTGTAQNITHNLGVAPELMIVKSRSVGGVGYDWSVYAAPLGAAKYASLNRDDRAYDDFGGSWNNTAPTASVFSVGTSIHINGSGTTFVNYLFASCPGVQSIQSYVGDGTTGRTINCGFTGGARFVCIKATSTTGSWWTFDSARGIVTNNDPALQLNSTAAEVTSADAIDTAASGFIVNQEATCSLNASGVSYLVWAIA